MPRTQNYQSYPAPGFGGGLNTAVHPTQIGEDDAQISTNVDYKVGGTFQKRYGYEQVGNTVHATNAGFCLDTFNLSNGTELLMYGGNDGVRKIFKLVASTFTNISATLTVSTLISSDTYQDRWYFSNGTDDYQYYDNVSVTAVASAPKGKYIKVHNDRMFVTGVSGLLSRLYYSVVGDAADFSGAGSGFIDINKNDGSTITGLEISEGVLTVGKYPQGMYRVDFDSDDVPFVTATPWSLGPTSQFSMSRVDNGMLYLANGEVDFIGRGQNLSEELQGNQISVKITPDIQALASTSAAASIFYQNKWYLACRTSGSSNNIVYTYDTILKCWSKYTNVNAAMWTVYGGVIHWAASNTGKVYKFNTSYSDPGSTAITMTWRGKETGLEVEDYYKTFRFIDVEHIATAGTQLVVTIYGDIDTTLLTETITYTSSGGSDSSVSGFGNVSFGMASFGGAEGGFASGSVYIPIRVSFPGRARRVSLQISNSQDAKNIQMLRAEWFFKTRTIHNYNPTKIQ